MTAASFVTDVKLGISTARHIELHDNNGNNLVNNPETVDLALAVYGRAMLADAQFKGEIQKTINDARFDSTTDSELAMVITAQKVSIQFKRAGILQRFEVLKTNLGGSVNEDIIAAGNRLLCLHNPLSAKAASFSNNLEDEALDAFPLPPPPSPPASSLANKLVIPLTHETTTQPIRFRVVPHATQDKTKKLQDIAILAQKGETSAAQRRSIKMQKGASSRTLKMAEKA